MTSTARVGFVSAMCLFVVGCVYMIVVAFGVRQVGLSEPILDPTLAVMELLTVVSALLFLVLMVVIYESASTERKVFGGMALTFAILMTGLHVRFILSHLRLVANPDFLSFNGHPRYMQ